MKRRKDYKLKPARSCERCEKPLVPRIFSGGEEEYSAYMKRRYCSLICANSRGKKGTSRSQVMVQVRDLALGSIDQISQGRAREALDQALRISELPCELQCQ